MKAKTWFRSHAGRLSIVGALSLLVCVLVVSESDAGYSVNAAKKAAAKNVSLKGIVTDSHDRPLVGATVYFIDSASINTTPILAKDVLSRVAEAYDEPLEDIVNDAEKVKTLPQAVTDKSGKFALKSKIKLSGSSKYYAFVVPAATDVDHLPGGDASRVAFSPKILGKTGLQIKMSWKVPADATYIGTTACYVCHGPGSKLDVTNAKKHGHALQFTKPGQDSANQNSAGHVGSNWGELAAKFTLATQATGKAPVAVTSGATVKTLFVADYDSSTATNNGVLFVIYEDSAGTSIVYAKMYLWKDAANKYYVTLENVKNKTDVNNFKTFEVPLLMGGYIRQRILLSVPGLKGAYKFIGYQAITGSQSQGKQSNYDRTRKPFSLGGSGGGSFTDFYETTTTNPNFGQFKIKYPLSKSVALPIPPATAAANPASNVNCAVCHLGMGSHVDMERDAVTGELNGHTVDDPNGLFDLGGDGKLQDIGINCEQCHGAGSKHREENLKALALEKAATAKGVKVTKKEDFTGKYIVQPQLLGADRASLICGRCHTGTGNTEEAPPGISRKEFIATYINDKVAPGMPLSKLWDGVGTLPFGKGGHEGFTYDNWLSSKHAKNDRQLVACDDCHDSMGDANYRYALRGDPDDSTSSASLCMKCHDKEIGAHMVEKTGSIMKGTGMNCIDCHMTRTGKGGAGRPALLIGTPVGATTTVGVSTDAKITYWENDQSSHSFLVPKKSNPATSGKEPGGLYPSTNREAMPTPYTNSCGNCHDATKLQYLTP